jgi:hypothetical protein
MSRYGIVSLFFLLALATELGALEANPTPMPEILRVGASSPGQLPGWVDASQVLTKDGHVNSQLLGAEAASDIARILAAQEKGGCIKEGEIIIDRIVNGVPPRRSSLEETFRSAAIAIRGRVTGRSAGLQGSFPGTLICFETIKVY